MNTNFLVIGSGIAGLWYGLRMAAHGDVVIVTKKNKAESNTNYAQGGIAAVLSPTDSFDSHVEDTLNAGAGLCDPEVVEMVVREGPDCVRELMEMGARFSRHDGDLHLGREGGHSAHRIIHAADMTGREIERVLLKQLDEHPNITMLEHHFCTDLMVENNHCYGAKILETEGGQSFTITAQITLLASGGSGRLFQHTTNPKVATGDGVAMAYRAGAKIANMEFVQFHPTSLYYEGESVFLISEAVRGAGAFLVNKKGERFMLDYHPLADLAPRDIVARGIDEQLKSSGEPCVYLDATHLAETEIRSHFPNIANMCKKYDIDMRKQPIPVVPAAHYQCGGVVTGKHARTSIDNLLACGEVAYTGLHGANRLASNSLLEALVYSTRAVEASLSSESSNQNSEPSAINHQPSAPSKASKIINEMRQNLRMLMSQQVGIVRHTKQLQSVEKKISELQTQFDSLAPTPHNVDYYELRNLLINAQLVVKSALTRQESRGLHSIKEFPKRSDAFLEPTYL